MWFEISFVYTTVGFSRLVSQRESKGSVCWVERMAFRVMDVVLLMRWSGPTGWNLMLRGCLERCVFSIRHPLMVSLRCNLYGLSGVFV